MRKIRWFITVYPNLINQINQFRGENCILCKLHSDSIKDSKWILDSLHLTKDECQLSTIIILYIFVLGNTITSFRKISYNTIYLSLLWLIVQCHFFGKFACKKPQILEKSKSSMKENSNLHEFDTDLRYT